MSLAQYVETLNLLGDESRMRLCALLQQRELCVTDLVKVTGLSQSRVSTHLGRLRDAGLVRDRRQGAQCFYGLAADGMPDTVRALLEEAAQGRDPTLLGDRQRLLELESDRRDGGAADDLERFYSPGRSWQSLALGIASLLELGDVLDVGTGDGAAAASIAPYCRSLTCVDVSPRMVEVASERLAGFQHVKVLEADGHALPFGAAQFDVVLTFHTLTFAAEPTRVLKECARVLRPGGRLVVLCLDEHQQQEVTARYGERHPGFSPRTLRGWLSRAGFSVQRAAVSCREAKKPHLQVVLATATKPRPSNSRS